MRNSGIVNLIILFLGNGLMFFNTTLKTKALSPSLIGKITIVNTISSIIFLFINLGISNIILKFYKNNDKKLITSMFVLINILLVFGCLCFWLTKNRINMEENEFFKYVYVFILISFYSSFFSSLNIVTGKIFVNNFCTKIIPAILNIINNYLLLISQIKIKEYMIFYLIISLIPIFIFFVVNYKEFDFKNKIKIKDVFEKRYLDYGKYFFLSNLAFLLINEVDKIMLKHFYSYKQVGFYSIILPFSSLFLILPIAFSQRLYPEVNKLISENKMGRLEEVYRENAQLQMYFGGIIFIFLANYFNLFFQIVNAEYTVIFIPMLIISFGRLTDISTGMCGTIINFSKYYKFDMYFTVLLLILSIVSNLIYIPKYGVLGATIATAVTLVIYNILKVFFVYKKLKVLPFNFESIKIILVLIFLGAISNKILISYKIINLLQLMIAIAVNYIFIDVLSFIFIEKQYSIFINLINIGVKKWKK